MTDIQLRGGTPDDRKLLARMHAHTVWANAVTAIAVCGAFAALFFGACPVVCS